MDQPRQTKIVATLGPASSSEEAIAQLIEAGVNVFRLNFSHGDHDSHRELIERIRYAAGHVAAPVAILQDLCGPKIRVSRLHEDKPMELVAGQEVILLEQPSGPVEPNQIGISLDGLMRDVRPGHPIMLDDGSLDLEVNFVDPDVPGVRCRVIHGGLLKPNKGVNFPKTRLSVPSMTEKDVNDLRFGLDQDVDFVALSFVRHESDLVKLRGLIEALNSKAKIIAKIEKAEAIHRMDAILMASDGIMVARGDLGVEFKLHEVPAIQKQLISRAVKFDRFVITATQMLESMTTNPRPTRAEVTDVANAIYDGTDAIMLSGETAAGQYPIRAVRMMATIAEKADRDLRDGVFRTDLPSDLDSSTFADALCQGAYTLAQATKTKLIVVYTRSGRTPMFMSRYRPCHTIVGATDAERVYRQLAVLRGVIPVKIPEVSTVRGLTTVTEKAILDRGIAPKDELIIHVGGDNVAARSNINSIRIRRLCED